jgi:hypothetical protein
MTTHAKLTKVCSLTQVRGPNPLRTQTIDGWFTTEPTVGRSFRFYAEPLTEGAEVRMVATSPVVRVVRCMDKREIVFNTENSTYEIEIQDPA